MIDINNWYAMYKYLIFENREKNVINKFVNILH